MVFQIKIKFFTTWTFNSNLKEDLENQQIFPFKNNQNKYIKITK